MIRYDEPETLGQRPQCCCLQIKRVFKLLGTPSEDSWPGMSGLPDYKPFPLYQPSLTFSQVVPKLSSRGRDLLQRLLICNPAGRMSAADSMNHIYFSDISPSVKN